MHSVGLTQIFDWGETLKMRFKLVNQDDPSSVYETVQRNFALGRSKECEIVINDPHISRVQARVRYEDSRFFIE